MFKALFHIAKISIEFSQYYITFGHDMDLVWWGVTNGAVPKAVLLLTSALWHGSFALAAYLNKR